jgi:hypothetical protein
MKHPDFGNVLKIGKLLFLSGVKCLGYHTDHRWGALTVLM